jgi:hypothetical protein
MGNVKHNLRAALRRSLLLLSFFVFCSPYGVNKAQSQTVPAVPVGAVVEEKLPADALVLSEGPVVIELFSSQACVFCPRADRLLADLAQQVHVIALACHVDYFDVRTGALSKPFCSERQNWYMRALHGGPNYTPQMVVQGRHDVIGYEIPAVTGALRKAAHDIPPAVGIDFTGTAGRYRVTLPALRKDQNFKLWLMVYDKPHDLIVSEGRNKGQKMSYVNIVSAMQDLGEWNALESDTMEVEVKRGVDQRGFAILAQDAKTGEIGAAGRYLFGQQKARNDAVAAPVPALND